MEKIQITMTSVSMQTIVTSRHSRTHSKHTNHTHTHTHTLAHPVYYTLRNSNAELSIFRQLLVRMSHFPVKLVRLRLKIH